MSAKQIIASIPSMSPEKRAIMRANAEKQRDTGNEAQRTAALEVLAALDQATADELAERRALLAAYGVKAAIVDSFGRSRMTETEEQVVRVLLDRPGSTSDELSRAIGWGGQSWHLHFGTMCFDRFAAYVSRRRGRTRPSILTRWPTATQSPARG